MGSGSPAGDGSFISVLGGEYQLIATLSLANKPPKEIRKNFTVSWPYDISSVGVTNPRTNGAPDFMMYPRGLDMAVSAVFQNTGLKNVIKFLATANIYNSKSQFFRNASL